MNRQRMPREARIVDVLMDGEAPVSYLSRMGNLSVPRLMELLEVLMQRGEVHMKVVPDRSGEPGRMETRYYLPRTRKVAA